MTLAASFDKRVTFQAPTDSVSATGVITRTWSTLATRWAQVMPRDKAERFIGSRDLSEGQVILRIRRDSTVAALSNKHRATYSGRTFEIDSVIDPAERGLELVIVCTERAGG